MRRLLKIVGRALLLAAAAVVVVYIGEDMLLRYRAKHGGADAVFDGVTTYESGAVKGGRQEFYFDQPQVETCVRAIFPHFGDAPCWYVRRHTIKQLTQTGKGTGSAHAASGGEAHGTRRSKLEVIRMPGWSERYTGHLGAKMLWTRSMVSRFSSGAAITNAT